MHEPGALSPRGGATKAKELWWLLWSQRCQKEKYPQDPQVHPLRAGRFLGAIDPKCRESRTGLEHWPVQTGLFYLRLACRRSTRRLPGLSGEDNLLDGVGKLGNRLPCHRVASHSRALVHGIVGVISRDSMDLATVTDLAYLALFAVALAWSPLGPHGSSHASRLPYCGHLVCRHHGLQRIWITVITSFLHLPFGFPTHYLHERRPQTVEVNPVCNQRLCFERNLQNLDHFRRKILRSL